MKFSATFVASIIAATTDEVAAFGVHYRHAVRSRPSTLRMSLDDLESKVLIEKPIRSAAVKSQPSRSPNKKAPAAPFALAPIREPILIADVAPVKKGKRKVEKYVDLGDVETPKAKASAPKSAPAPKLERKNPPPAKKEERPNRIKIPSPPSKPVVARADDVKDANAGPLGVALGAAPLLIAPLIALSAARGALGNTAARREKIQEAIAAKERAAKAKSASVSVDAGGVIGSLGFLGAAFAAVGVALTQSLAGSGLLDSSISIPLPTMPSAPKVSFSNPNPIGSRAAVSAPKSTISYLKGYDLDGDSGLTPKQQRAAAKKAAEEKAASAAAEKAAATEALKKERLERLNEMRSRPTTKVEVAKESSADRVAKVAAEKKAREAAAAEKKAELAKAEVAKKEAAKAEVAKKEAAKAEVAKKEAAKAEVAKKEAAKAEVAKKEAAKAEVAKKEAAKADKAAAAKKDAAAKAEVAKKDEAAKASAMKVAPVEKKVEAPVAAPKPEPTPPSPVIVDEAPAPAPKVEPTPPAPVPITVPVVAKSAPLPAPVVSIPAPVGSAPGALGAVIGGESGGKKLEKETVSAETLEFLKNYQK